MNTVSSLKPLLAARVILAAIAGFGLSTVVQAGEPVDPQTTRETRLVDYSDLDLSAVEGTTVLYARLRNAAEQVCGDEPRLIELRRHAGYRSCVEATLGEAVRDVSSSSLQAMHASRAPSEPLG